jgi:hypothetical protein
VSDFVAHGHNGLLVDTDDEMVAALTRLATSPLLRSAMTLHNARSESGFSWRNVLRICEDVYALAGAPGPGAAQLDTSLAARRAGTEPLGGVAAR